ncbi:MAG: 30S ribosomal protein S8 [Candidatus Andersenbacteria bacterium]|nr:30S ribosomal protein S8 [Candidatus Andersenbacteria bacterium]
MDTVADLLTGLVNAQRVGKERFAVPYSRYKEQLVNLLRERGVVRAVRAQRTARPKLVVTLAANKDRAGTARRVRRVSRPGRRQYVARHAIPWQAGRAGFYILSTSQGLMDGETARQRGLGGEIICEVQ